MVNRIKYGFNLLIWYNKCILRWFVTMEIQKENNMNKLYNLSVKYVYVVIAISMISGAMLP